MLACWGNDPLSKLPETAGTRQSVHVGSGQTSVLSRSGAAPLPQFLTGLPARREFWPHQRMLTLAHHWACGSGPLLCPAFACSLSDLHILPFSPARLASLKPQ